MHEKLVPKDPKIGSELKALDLDYLQDVTGNLYYTVVIMSKRSNQIGASLKAELNEKLAEFITVGESLEEVVENREQIEIAKHYEEMPKPTLLAIKEMLQGDTKFENNNPELPVSLPS